MTLMLAGDSAMVGRSTGKGERKESGACTEH